MDSWDLDNEILNDNSMLLLWLSIIQSVVVKFL